MGKIFSGSTCSLSRDKPESYINPYTLGAQIWVRRCDEDHTLLRCVADPKSKRTTQMDTRDENAPPGPEKQARHSAGRSTRWSGRSPTTRVRSYPSARAGRSHARPRPRTEPQRRLTPAKLDSASRSHSLDCLGAAFGPPLLLRVSAAPLSGAFPDGARLASGRLLAFRRSEHDRIVGCVIIRALGEPVVIGCDPKHHRPNCWIVSLFRPRPHFLGSHAPVRWGLEEIIRVGDCSCASKWPS
jgi:hypothetical protein